MKLNYNKEIGRLYEVYGNYVKAYITYNAKDDLQFNNSNIERIGKVGQHVIIPNGFEKIVGRIDKISINDPIFNLVQKSKLPDFPYFIKIIEISLLGTIYQKDNKKFFDKGIKGYPSAEDTVCSISNDELKLIFLGESQRSSILIGSLAEDEAEKVNIDIERLFQSHFSILGATNSGKTCTLICNDIVFT